MRTVKRAYNWMMYTTAVGSVMLIEAMAHPALAQTIGGIGGSFGGTLDPTRMLQQGVPFAQTICGGGVAGLCAAKGFAAAHRHESFMPHALGAAGGGLMIYGAPAMLRHFGVPI